MQLKACLCGICIDPAADAAAFVIRLLIHDLGLAFLVCVYNTSMDLNFLGYSANTSEGISLGMLRLNSY